MIPKKRVVILGAGASGLAVACALAQKGNTDVTILEADKRIGGLSKTIEHEGILFDIGPHRLSGQLPRMVEFVKGLIGDDLIEKRNIHGVYFEGFLYNYPPKLKDFLNLRALKKTFDFGISWAWARFLYRKDRLMGRPRPKSFEEILLRNFGKSFYRSVIFPMMHKVWGTNDLHPDFTRIRFIKPTFHSMIKNILLAGHKEPHTMFYYPVKGYGQICDAMGEYAERNGCKIELEARIESIKANTLKGPFTVFYTQKGASRSIEADIVVSSISNRFLISYLSGTGLVGPLLQETDNFISRTLWLSIFVVKGFHLPARVIIFPEKEFMFNRISEMNLFHDLGYPEGRAVIMVDTICDKDSNYDLMKEAAFNNRVLDSVLSLGWFKRETVEKKFSVRFPNTYPVLNPRRYNAQERIEQYFAETGICLCGREASSDYNNTHNAMFKAFVTADYILGQIGAEEYKRVSRMAGRLPIQD